MFGSMLLLIGIPLIGWYLFTGIFDLFVKKSETDLWSSSDKTTFNDYSQHTHFHVHSNEKSKEIKKLTDNTIDVEHKEL